MKNFLTFCCGAALSAAAFLLTGWSTFSADQRVNLKSTIDCNYGRDKFLEVRLDEFMRDLARYRRMHAKVISPQLNARVPGQEPSRVCTYSLDTLKKFICYIEQYAAKVKLSSSQLGIRFYYGAYPKNQRIANQPYGGLHTLFMVPAYKDPASGNYMDTDLKSSAEQRYKKFSIPLPYKLSDIFAIDSTNSVFMLDASAVIPPKPALFRTASLAPEPKVLNQGQLCPPNCPPRATTMLGISDARYPGGLEY